MKNDLHFSSKNQKWETEPKMIADLATVFSWDLDVCASRPNVCENFYSEEDDALTKEWTGKQLRWMNPEYTDLPIWMPYARKMHQKYGGAIVCLVTAKTDTRWWHKNVTGTEGVVLIKGRVKFGSPEYWEEHWSEKIMGFQYRLSSAHNKGEEEERDEWAKKLLAVTRKIGGKNCGALEQNALFTYADLVWGSDPTCTKYLAWKEKDYIRSDAAPFPSAFVVFGWWVLSREQKEKLISYGMQIEVSL